MTSGPANRFEYKDRNFGDTHGTAVTTSLLLGTVRKFVNPGAALALDLGCGSGIVAGMAEAIARHSPWYPLDSQLLFHWNVIDDLRATKIYSAGN